jgi:hypothetical protein
MATEARDVASLASTEDPPDQDTPTMPTQPQSASEKNEESKDGKESENSIIPVALQILEADFLSEPPHITTLQTETHLKIFSHLNTVHSTCVGLACKQFHEIHFSIHGRVSTEAWCGDFSPSEIARAEREGKILVSPLCDLLETWMGPNLVYSMLVGMFVRRERHEALVRQRERVLQLAQREEPILAPELWELGGTGGSSEMYKNADGEDIGKLMMANTWFHRIAAEEISTEKE